MINQISAIAVKELKVLLQDRNALRMLFLIPICFILVMTVALQGLFNTGTSNNPIHLLVVNQDTGQIASKVIQDLRGIDGLKLTETSGSAPLTRAEAETLIDTGRSTFALVFPADFSASILRGSLTAGQGSTTVTFIADPAANTQILSPVRGMVEGYVEREAFIAQMPGEIEQGLQKTAKNLPASQAAALQGLDTQIGSQLAEVSAVRPDSSSAEISYVIVPPAGFHAQKTPNSAQQNVPAYTVYGVFFIMGTIATSMFREKSDGTFTRLKAAPLPTSAYLIGKLAPYFAVNLVQIGLMFAVGVVVFHMSLGNDPLALALLAVVTAASATGLGLLITTLGKTLEQVSGVSVLLSILLSAVGGMMVPVSVMPKAMQIFARITPHYWALDGFQDVMVRGLGLTAVLPVAGIILGFALVFWTAALLRFRYD